MRHECCNKKLIIINWIPNIFEWENKDGWFDSVEGLTLHNKFYARTINKNFLVNYAVHLLKRKHKHRGRKILIFKHLIAFLLEWVLLCRWWIGTVADMQKRYVCIHLLPNEKKSLWIHMLTVQTILYGGQENLMHCNFTKCMQIDKTL